MMDGQISEEDIMELMKTPEGQAILQEIMGAESSGEAVGGEPMHMMPDGSMMEGTTHADKSGAELSENIYNQSPDAMNVLEDPSKVPMVTETGVVDPMMSESLEKRRMIEELLRAQGGAQINIRR
jgi:predicted heme/steroid binding protein